MIDYITGLWIDQNHPAFKMKILLALLTSLTFVVSSRIECNWASQFLCGDECLGLQNTCRCGKYKFGLKYANSYYCCQEPNTSCRRAWNGDIQCQGEALWWNKPCNGTCIQNARYGYTMLPCADQEECYLGIEACQGTPKCTD